METVDLAVVGAGWYGICAVKTYLEINPTANITVLEEAATAGGTWAQHRLYRSLITNNMYGMLHFPDFPMDESRYGVKAGQHVPGEVMQQYITDYAKKFGVYGRIRFHTKVDTIEATEGDQWLINTLTSSVDSNTVIPGQIQTSKLIVSTGLTHQPNMPEIPGMETFGGPMMHARYALASPSTFSGAKSIVVLGSGKSAFDSAYAQITTNGVTIDMVIRKSGKGPVWMSPPYVTPLKRWLEKLITTRLLTWFSPCTWGADDGYGGIRSWLHGTAVGRFVVSKYWNILSQDLISLNAYGSHPELKKLQPWYPSYYVGAQLSIQNYPVNILDFVKEGKIRVHISDVDSISKDTVHLSNGEHIQTNGIICATGWQHRPAVNFTNVTAKQLGLPYTDTEHEPLADRANQEIIQRFPSLREQPKIPLPPSDQHPYRLYRFLIPPEFFGKRNIAFAGYTTHTVKAMMAPIQSLWLAAYFAGKLERMPDSDDDARWQAVLHTQMLKWRYPLGNGAKHPDFVFDALPYIDQLMADLGLQRWRKGGRFAEATQPYSSDDYAGVVDEWIQKQDTATKR